MTEPTMIIPIISAIAVGLVGGTGYLISLVHRTRENYVPNTSCKENRDELKEMLKEYRDDTREFRKEQLGTVKHIHERLDDIKNAIKSNGKQI